MPSKFYDFPGLDHFPTTFQAKKMLLKELHACNKDNYLILSQFIVTTFIHTVST